MKTSLTPVGAVRRPTSLNDGHEQEGMGACQHDLPWWAGPERELLHSIPNGGMISAGPARVRGVADTAADRAPEPCGDAEDLPSWTPRRR